MPPKLVQLTSRKEDLEFLDKLAKLINFESRVVTNADALEEVLMQDSQSVVMFDVDAPDILDANSPLSVGRMLPVISKYLPPSRVFALSSKNLFELPHLARILAIGHYCVRNYDAFAFEWLSKIIVPLFSQDPCDMQYYVDTGTNAAKLKLTRSTEKNKVLNGISAILAQKKVNDRCAEVVIRSLDEMLMNAMFDAPVDAQGRTYRRAVDRDADFYLDGVQEVEVSVALNKESIVICVQDQFGSLSPKAALAAIQKDYSQMAYKADAQTKSAGLGLQGIASSGLGMLLNVKQKQLTQAIITLPYFKNYKKMKTSFRAFSLNIK